MFLGTSTVNWRIIAIVFLVIGMVGKPVRAAGEPRWYVGIGVGSSDVDNGDFDDDRGMKAFVGYGLSETFALEGGFINAGDFAAKDSPGTSIKIEGFQFVGVGNLQLTQKFSLLGKAGVYICNADKTVAGFSESDGGTFALFGVGIEYDAKPTLRGEWEHTHLGGGGIDLFSVSIVFRF